MNILKDKKKLPIIVGLLAVVVILAGGVVAYTTGLIGGQRAVPLSSSETTTTTSTPARPGAPATARSAMAPSAGAGAAAESAGGEAGEQPMGAGSPGRPRTAAAKPSGATKIVGAQPSSPAKPAVQLSATGTPSLTALPPGYLKSELANGPDPFKPPTKPVVVNPRIANRLPPGETPPAIYIYRIPEDKKVARPGQDQHIIHGDNITRKLYGVMVANGISALLESNGDLETVHPGSTVPGGKVVAIQPDSITIHTNDDRLLHIDVGGSDSGALGPTSPAGAPPGMFGGGNAGGPIAVGPDDNSGA